MNLFEVSVCTKAIYNYIAMGLLKVKNIDLRQKVRRRKRKEKKNHDDGRTLGESIDCRDPLIDERSTFGNWELDTIVGKKGTDPVLLAADERIQAVVRVSMYTSCSWKFLALWRFSPSQFPAPA